MDLETYRNSHLEKLRTSDLLELIPHRGKFALDIGARDGHFSRLLAERFDFVTALDLEVPNIQISNVTCQKGDIRNLQFDDNSFDLVFCAEVLEHIPPNSLSRACAELSRVCSQCLVVGVPYKQDIRIGRTTCSSCGKVSPPWGHVNSFDESKLEKLFPELSVNKISLVGRNDEWTNSVSTFLMDLARNPYGTYGQEEPCLHCNEKLVRPPGRSLIQKIFTRAAVYANKATEPLNAPRANWIHMVLMKQIK
jgi:SAM-dependent methyltransferase